MSLPEFNEDYQRQSYWEARYQEENSFEWCCDVSQWCSLLDGIIAKDAKLLILGCGNSSMSADLYSLGYNRIVNVDYSPAVVHKMKEKYSSFPGMEWYTMDMFDLQFPESEFDCVMEKCTLEVLFVKKDDPWNPSQKVIEDFQKVMNQVFCTDVIVNGSIGVRPKVPV